MVLSNKKLKQKLRAAVTESLTTKESTKPKSQSNKSFTELLTTAIQNPRLSKREKKRKTLPLQGVKAVEESNGDAPNEEAVIEEKKKKKRQREEEGGSGVSKSAVEKRAKKKLKKVKMLEKFKKLKEKKKEKRKQEVEPEITEAKEEEETVEVNESQEKVDVATKVYVGGIPFYSTEEDIRSFFEGCGTITEIDCMTFAESGKFRGIAMITFKTEAAAKRALALDGADMGGLFLKIQPYKINKPQKSSYFAPKIVEGYNRVYVGNMSWDITEEDLKKLFSDCKISSIRFGEDKTTGEFRGYGHVDFSDSQSLTNALKLDQTVVCGRPIKISCAVPKKKAENQSKSVSKNIKAESGSGSFTGDKKKRRTCYECGVAGHLSSGCPNKRAVDTVNTKKE